ncbi:MAG: hemolysin family protein, partial [Tepidiformaceae bacterium]
MADWLVPTVIVTVLILLNGLFVAAEFAIAGAPRATMQRRAAEGNRVAGIVHRLLENPRAQDQYIATAQLGITAASLGLGMYGEHALATWIYDQLHRDGVAAWLASHTIASIAAIAILTYFHIVIGEMIPKALALQRAEQTALWITPPMLWVRRLLLPFVLGLNAIGNGLLALMGVRRQLGQDQYYSASELEYVVRESLEGGMLASEAGQVLTELFDFGDRTAGDLLTPRVNVHGIPVGANRDDVATIVVSNRHTRYPVYESDMDHIIGVIHIKDILAHLEEGALIDRSDVRPVPYIPETTTVDVIMDVMRRERSQLVVVLDEHGGTAGVVTIEDLYEEVVGKIQEDIADLPDIVDDGAGRLHVVGTVRLDEVGERFEAELEHDDIDTVSGLILSLLGRPPEIGDSVDYRGFRFQVAATSGHGVSQAVITR